MEENTTALHNANVVDHVLYYPRLQIRKCKFPHKLISDILSTYPPMLSFYPKGVDVEENMTEKEKMDYMRNQERDYRRRMDRARPCMLPSTVHN